MPRWSFIYRFAFIVVAAVVLAGCPVDPAPDSRPEANFTADPRSGNTGLVVSFTDLSTTVSDDEILSWQWNFGDGSRSTEPNPNHTYLTSGDFTVSLTVVSSGGSHTRTRPGYIQITSPAGSDQLDGDGGTVSANGVSVAVPEGALEGRVDFGITRLTTQIPFSAFETINRVGDTFRITHTSETALSNSSDDEPLIATRLSLPYAEDVVPTGERTAAKVHIIAQLPSGEVVPILGTIGAGQVHADVLDMPQSALYTVVYRPDAYLATATVENQKAPTSTSWADSWRVGLSPALLTQLTALRLGSVEQSSSFYETDFTEAQLAATETAMLDGILAVQARFEAVQSRGPRLLTPGGSYAALCFNFQSQYATTFERFDDALYAANPFGQIVVDPRQMIALSGWNADRFQADLANIDIAQIVGPDRAIAEVLTRAVVGGYDYPDVAVSGPGDESPFNFAAGIEEGLALYLGQVNAGIEYGRAQLPGDEALLSTPLLAPIDLQVPGYAAAGQDFFRYVANRYEPAPELGYIAGGDGVVKGLLEEIRLSLSGLVGPSYSEVAEQTALAIDRSMTARLEASLSTVFYEYALDLAFERGPAAILRPSDADLLPLVLDPTRFAAGAILTGTMEEATSTLEFPTGGQTGLTAIEPLSARVAIVSANPAADALSFTFERGDGVEAVIYREGLPGNPLMPEDNNVLTFTGFEADAGSTLATFYVIVVNTNVTTSNNVAISVASSVTE